MHYPTDFCDSQRARGLFNHFQREGERHWPITAHTGFQRFALDQFHGIEALTVLLSVVSHAGDIWMMNVRSCACLAQKTRPRPGILSHASADDLESNNRIQNRIVSAVRYRHRPSTELNRETICAYFHFEVGVA